MKRTILLIIIATILQTNFSAQAPTWQWAKGAGGNSSDFINGICNDNSGNVIVAGFYSSPTMSLDNNTLSNAGSINIYVAKYTSAGNLVWARSAGGPTNDQAHAVCADANDNVFITGCFASPMLVFGTTTLSSPGGISIYIAKYNSAGTLQWAKIEGDGNDTHASSVKTDAAGNSYVTGYFKSPTITFGTFTLTNTDQLNGTYDMFVVKYNPAGNVVWAKSAGGLDSDQGKALSVDNSGNILVTGEFSSAMMTIGTSTLANGSMYAIFTAKYDPTGNVIWAKASSGGMTTDEAKGISTDVSGNVFVCGNFYNSSISFGGSALTNSSSGTADIFVVKYSPQGNVIWTKRAGGSWTDECVGICNDAGGNVIITGNFASPTISFGNNTFTSAGNWHLYVCKFDPSGSVVWAKDAGEGDYGSYGISMGPGDNAYIGGQVSQPTLALGSSTITNNGPLSDIFIAKLNTISTDLIEATSVESLLCFPNPVKEKLFIGGKNSLGPVLNVEIFNALGALTFTFESLQTQIKSADQLELDLSHLGPGIYYVKIETDSGVVQSKIVKE